MKKILVCSCLAILAFISVEIFISSTGNPDAEYAKLFKENHHTYALNLPKDLSFAGEKVPLEIFDVQERIDREMLVNVYWQSQTLLLIKRAHRWFPVIEP